MIGRSFGDVFPDRAKPGDEVVLRVSKLRRPPDLEEASFEVRAGEILGIGGLVGAGRTELLRAIGGVDQAASGEVWVAGRKVRRGRPDIAVAAGIGMAPEERKSQGLWLDWSQVRNVTISRPRSPQPRPVHRPRRRAPRGPEAPALARRCARTIRCAWCRSSSGGNQQKVVLARWLLHSSKVLLLDEPTRGVDVGAKPDVYRVISELAARGLAIVMVSSELSELAGFCDRILVMREGALVAALEGDDMNEEEILRHALRIAPDQTRSAAT